jgi:hypothetical protein
MRLLSFEKALQEADRTRRRFPFVLACAALGTAVALILVDHEGPSVPSILFKTLFGAILGLPLLTALTLISERRAWSRSVSLALHIVGALMLIGYGFTVPWELLGAPIYHLQRVAMLAIALCGFLVVGPYLRLGQINGFWQYCKVSVFRVLLAGLYSVTLFAGLAIALAALDNLFGINVPVRRFVELWVLIVGIFATWFFLAGVPENLDELDSQEDYPKGLKVFAQYVLLPLMFVYLVILYAYLGKIVIQWSWPHGWVSMLTLCFAAAGIVTILLLHPIREKTENMWIKAATRWFWVIMIPPIVMLLLAITRRVSEYGITEGRYVGFGLGVWLAVMAVYFIFSRSKSIKVIPGTLAAASLLICFGPWGAFQVSETSQISRLQTLLVKNGILVNAKVQKAPGIVPSRDAVQISSIVRYLCEIHGYGGIQGWFTESLALDSTVSGGRSKEPADITKMMGVEYRLEVRMDGARFLEIAADPYEALNVRGYEHMLIGQRFNPGKPGQAESGSNLTCSFDSGTNVLTLILKSVDGTADSLRLLLEPLADTLLSHYDESGGGSIPAEQMTLVAVGNRLRVKVCFRSINFRSEKDRLRPFAFDADILYSSGAPMAPSE